MASITVNLLRSGLMKPAMKKAGRKAFNSIGAYMRTVTRNSMKKAGKMIVRNEQPQSCREKERCVIKRSKHFARRAKGQKVPRKGATIYEQSTTKTKR